MSERIGEKQRIEESRTDDGTEPDDLAGGRTLPGTAGEVPSSGEDDLRARRSE